MEAVVSNFGYLPGDAEFLQGIRRLTEDLGILLIFDEVQSFRTAPGGAQERLGVVPDMTALGKIIGGGLPVGAFGGRRDLMEQFDPRRPDAIPHAGTFNGNPMTMVAGEATLRSLTPDVYERLDRLGAGLRAKLQAVLDELEVQAVVTGIASLFAISFGVDSVRDYRSKLRGRLGHVVGRVHRPAERGHPAAGEVRGRALHPHDRVGRRHPRRRGPQRGPETIVKCTTVIPAKSLPPRRRRRVSRRVGEGALVSPGPNDHYDYA